MTPGANCATTGGLGWDADGVIVDSRMEAWRAAADIAGLFGPRPLIHSAAAKDASFGRSAQAVMAGEDGAPALRAMHRILMRHRASRAGTFSEVLAIVSRLTTPPPLISAAYSSGIKEILGPDHNLFCSISGCEDGPKDQRLAKAAAQGLSWYVTDTRADVKRCLACGIRPICVAWGYDEGPGLRTAGAEVLVETPGQLATVLTQLGFIRTMPTNPERSPA